jgi:hypothetical protein
MLLNPEERLISHEAANLGGLTSPAEPSARGIRRTKANPAEMRVPIFKLFMKFYWSG